jgi:hypothetical protein
VKAQMPGSSVYEERYVGELLDIHKDSLSEFENYSEIRDMVEELAESNVSGKDKSNEKE